VALLPANCDPIGISASLLVSPRESALCVSGSEVRRREVPRGFRGADQP